MRPYVIENDQFWWSGSIDLEWHKCYFLIQIVFMQVNLTARRYCSSVSSFFSLEKAQWKPTGLSVWQYSAPHSQLIRNFLKKLPLWWHQSIFKFLKGRSHFLLYFGFAFSVEFFFISLVIASQCGLFYCSDLSTAGVSVNLTYYDCFFFPSIVDNAILISKISISIPNWRFVSIYAYVEWF